jgi:hypothetical protein
LRCGNIVLLTLRFLDVAKFTNLTPLSLLISCKISFPIVGGGSGSSGSSGSASSSSISSNS